MRNCVQSSSKVKRDRHERLRNGLPVVDLAYLDLVGNHQAPKEHGHGVGAGQLYLSFNAATGFLIKTLISFITPRRFLLQRVHAGKKEQPVPGILESIGDAPIFRPSFAQEHPAVIPSFDGNVGAEHVQRETDASKVALVHLVARLIAGGFRLLDTQFVTTHLKQFGTVEISRDTYRRYLHEATVEIADFEKMPTDYDPSEVLQVLSQTS